MAKLLINGKLPIEGKMSIQRAINKQGEVEAQGQLSTEEYIEEITKIETERYLVTGVDVFAESFGSETREIVYVFKASFMEVKS